MKHSPLGASSIKRIRACNASYLRSMGLPPLPTSKAALEGTRLHDLAEKRINENNVKDLDKEPIQIRDYVRDCIEFKKEAELYGVETRVSILGHENLLFGTVDFWFYKDETLYLVDLKTGRTKVNAIFNEQLLYYTNGVIDSQLKEKKVKKVVNMIYQIHSDMDYVDEFEPSIESVLDFKEKLIKLKTDLDCLEMEVKKGLKLKGNVGDHCVFCPAKNTCMEYQSDLLGDI